MLHDRSQTKRTARRTLPPFLAFLGVMLLALAAPAVARPSHLPTSAGALPTAQTIAVLCVAALFALALVLVAVFTGRQERPRVGAEIRRAARSIRESGQTASGGLIGLIVHLSHATMRRVTMHERRKQGSMKRRWTFPALLALGAVVLLTAAAPAAALRPRTTPRHAEALAARAAAVHEAHVALATARHDAAALPGSPGGTLRGDVAGARPWRDPIVLTSTGAIAVGSIAAVGAVVLVALAVLIGRGPGPAAVSAARNVLPARTSAGRERMAA